MDQHIIDHCLAAPDAATLAERMREALLAEPLDRPPLAAACTHGGLIAEGSLAITVLSSERDHSRARVRLGVLFSERVGGCNCHDDPQELNGYAVIEISLDADGRRLAWRYVDEG